MNPNARESPHSNLFTESEFFTIGPFESSLKPPQSRIRNSLDDTRFSQWSMSTNAFNCSFQRLHLRPDVLTFNTVHVVNCCEKNKKLNYKSIQLILNYNFKWGDGIQSLISVASL